MASVQAAPATAQCAQAKGPRAMPSCWNTYCRWVGERGRWGRSAPGVGALTAAPAGQCRRQAAAHVVGHCGQRGGAEQADAADEDGLRQECKWAVGGRQAQRNSGGGGRRQGLPPAPAPIAWRRRRSAPSLSVSRILSGQLRRNGRRCGPNSGQRAAFRGQGGCGRASRSVQTPKQRQNCVRGLQCRQEAAAEPADRAQQADLPQSPSGFRSLDCIIGRQSASWRSGSAAQRPPQPFAAQRGPLQPRSPRLRRATPRRHV